MNTDHNAREGTPEPDSFELGLGRHPFRAPPPEWREAILAAAAGRIAEGAARTEVDWRRAARAVPWWERLWSGWTVAAAAWALVLGLNQFSSGTGETVMARAPLSPAAAAFLAEQQRAAMGSLAATAPESVAPARSLDRDRNRSLRRETRLPGRYWVEGRRREGPEPRRDERSWV